MIKFVLSILASNLFIANCSFSLDSTYIFNGYTFIVTSNNSNIYGDKLQIIKNNKMIFDYLPESRIENVEKVDFNNDGNEIYLITEFSGGAHCCYVVDVAKFVNDKLIFYDTLGLGNSTYEILDLNDDGNKEFVYYNDELAYAFSSFATSYFNRTILVYHKDHLINNTQKYTGIILEDIKHMKWDLDKLIVSDFQCDPPGTEVFSQKSGPAKSILAAIVASYYSINEVQKGYDIIDEVYECDDKIDFKNILKYKFNFN